MDENGERQPAARPAPSAAAPTPAAGAWTQRVGALCAVPRLLIAHGADPQRVLAGAGLGVDALDDPERRIPFAAATALLARCVQATGCAHFGVLAGAEWHLSDLGLPGQLARHSGTLDEGLRTLVVYLRLNNQGAATYLRTTGASTELGYAVFHPALTELAVTYDVVMASAVNQVREMVADASWRPVEVLLPRSVPADERPYRERFGISVRFNADRAALRLRTSELKRRLPEADALRKAALLREAEARLGEPFRLRVYATLRTLMMEGVVRSDHVAANLTMHKRTLARRLAEDGTTFQRVLDEVRFDVARQLLRETDRTVADVAGALGYAEPSVFTRSFRRWSGRSPAEWRKDARA